jgi:hypothetical protein
MRLIVACCFTLAFTSPIHAQGDKPKPNTLTPKEIADGWILLFDGESTFGWTQNVNRMAKINEGSLDLSDTLFGEFTTKAVFGDFELSFEYKLVVGPAVVYLDNVVDGKAAKSRVIRLQMSGAWTLFQLRHSKGKLRYLSNGPIVEADWPSANRIGIGHGQDAKTLQVRNIKLRPLNTKSLFNGKDLTGWKDFPGKKSQFAVKDGAINVNDGPGDLQTVGKYKDFLLQLECISNGKHLNSGIFFRCRDNEYQNGYEAQIRNEFKAEPQKYLVEEYDPKTNKLMGKKEVLSNAFDFGTGAIYRRVPARKQMSKDNEWFGMTIVAHGNHLATWVNGVQVADWTDNRPKSDNARTGCKLDAGHISIQGHDPTTDLSFKNFRIAEFK